jgi:hypothetical protein
MARRESRDIGAAPSFSRVCRPARLGHRGGRGQGGTFLLSVEGATRFDHRGLTPLLGLLTAAGCGNGLSVGQVAIAVPDAAVHAQFTERPGSRIVRVTTTGEVTPFDIPTAGSGPTGIASSLGASRLAGGCDAPVEGL